ncbi:MAG: hypothetical protein AB8H47_13195 [Bacteroidia bacterium]
MPSFGERSIIKELFGPFALSLDIFPSCCAERLYFYQASATISYFYLMDKWLSHSGDWQTAFRFPLQHDLAKKEITIGALWLLVPVIGWLLNMGHRIMLVHQMQKGSPGYSGISNTEPRCTPD